MGGLFYTGQSRRTSGSFTVTCSGAEDIVKRLNKLENGGQTAIKKTVNDFMSRAPAWVSKGIREHYGVDTAAINEAKQQPRRGQSSIQVAGVQVDSASLVYKGRTLTPTHFKMSPKSRPSAQQKKPIRIPRPTDRRSWRRCNGSTTAAVPSQGDDHQRLPREPRLERIPHRWKRWLNASVSKDWEGALPDRGRAYSVRASDDRRQSTPDH